MPERLHPGVYVEEVPSTVRAIEGVSTSTAAFVGVAECGPVGEPVLVTSFKEYQDKFGGFLKDSFLTYSVLNFFENGGRKCYIVRVVGKDAKPASIELRDRERVVNGTAIYDIYPEAVAEPVLRISAASKGKWGNDIDIEIKDSTNDPSNEFKIVVKRREEVLEVWDNLSMVMGDDNYVEDVLGNGQSTYINIERIDSATTESPGILISGVLDDAAKNLKNPAVDNPSLKISLNDSLPVEIVLETNGNSIDIAADITAKVRESVGSIDIAKKKAFEKFECQVVTLGSDERYLLTSGEGGSASSVTLPDEVTDSTQDVLDRLKLSKDSAPGVFISGVLDAKAKDLTNVKGPNLKIELNGSETQKITLDQKDNSNDIAADIKVKVRELAEKVDATKKPAFEKFECMVLSTKSGDRYVFISGEEGSTSSVVVKSGEDQGDDQHDVLETLKLNKSLAPGVFISGVLDAKAKDLTNVKGPNLKIELNGSETQKITLDQKDNSNDIAADIKVKVRELAEKVDATKKPAFEKFECMVFSTESGDRYVFISGKEGYASSVVVKNGITDDKHDSMLNRLKLNQSAVSGTDKAVAISGLDLQVGTSRSENEPSTIIGSRKTLSFNLNRDGFQSIQLDSGLTDGDKIADNIQNKVRNKKSARKDPVNEDAYNYFTAEYTSQYELVFGQVDADAGTFTFVAPKSGDLTINNILRLSATDSIHVKEDMVERERTIASDSSKNFRPITTTKDVKEGKIGLRIDYPSLSVNIEIPVSADLPSGEKIAEDIQNAVRQLEKDIDKTTDTELVKLKDRKDTHKALQGFKARYIAYYILKSGTVLTRPDLGPISSVEVLPSPIEDEDAAIDLGLGISNGGIEQSGAAMLRPVNGEYHLGDNTEGGAVYRVFSGSNGDAPTDDDFIGDNGLKLLDKVDDINIIAIPGRGSKKVVSAGLGYTMNRKLQDCFFIGDMGGPNDDDPLPYKDKDNPFINTRDKAIKFARTLPVKSDFGAIYTPWIKAPDPIGRGKNPTRYLPPSGYMAGIYARIDGKRGVFKAPAGTEANLIGTWLPALDLAVKIDDTDQDFLNPIGVNVIRSFPASGIVAWGARTMGSDSAWRYISVRRMAIFLRVSIYNGIQWAVFEPNDEPLWSSLRLNIGSFMYNQFRAGAFQGSIPSEAYFVRCDSTTTTQQDIDNGVVNVLVGFAPLKPAEFVVIKLSQKAGQTPK